MVPRVCFVFILGSGSLGFLKGCVSRLDFGCCSSLVHVFLFVCALVRSQVLFVNVFLWSSWSGVKGGLLDVTCFDLRSLRCVRKKLCFGA